MALQCNIERKGRWLRFWFGVACGVAAVGVVGLWPARGNPTPLWGWGLCGVFAVAAALCFFQAAQGWCIARAAGFKTRY